MRPAATPSAAGITPGHEHLVTDGERVSLTRGQYRRLVGRVEALEAEAGAMKSAAETALATLNAHVRALYAEVRALKRRLSNRRGRR